MFEPIISILGSYIPPHLYVVSLIFLFALTNPFSDTYKRNLRVPAFFTRYYEVACITLITASVCLSPDEVYSKTYSKYVSYEFLAAQVFCISYNNMYSIPMAIMAQTLMDNTYTVRWQLRFCRAVWDTMAYLDGGLFPLKKGLCHAVVVTALNLYKG